MGERRENTPRFTACLRSFAIFDKGETGREISLSGLPVNDNGAVNGSSTIINGLDRRRSSFCRQQWSFRAEPWRDFNAIHTSHIRSSLIASNEEETTNEGGMCMRDRGVQFTQDLNFRIIRILIVPFLERILEALCLSRGYLNTFRWKECDRNHK